ncbi:MAG: 2-isopropylmalate synthase, partial [Terriglobia bacterium]
MDEKLIFDWNTANGAASIMNRRVLLNDESLRDGLQSPSVRDPSIDEKIEILHLMDEVGINALDLGLPGAGPRARADVERLAREIIQGKLKIQANCAARTLEADITPIAEVVQRTGLEIEAATFIGSSPIRRFTEEWTVDHLVRTTERALRYAVNLGLPVMYVTEDTTRADPETIKLLYTTAIQCGARAICVCDTVGHATPSGVRNLIRFVIDEVVTPSGAAVRVDWHGHSDRGLAIPNCLAALEAGADQLHGCALGIGERVGNASMDQLLVNLKLMGIIHQDLSKLKLYCQAVSKAT